MQAFATSLTYPLHLSLCLLAVAIVLLLVHWRKTGIALLAVAAGWSLLWSIPQCSDWLRGTLERRIPLVDASALPQADAIVVLGGASNYSWLDREDVRPEELKSSRVAAGARAWLAGRAPVVILSGNREETDGMAAAIGKLGVPASALLPEKRSRNTSENAANTAELARRRKIRSLLLVTSALHMPRALLLFRQTGMEVVPVPVPEHAAQRHGFGDWLPSRHALWRSGRAFKEYAGLIVAGGEAR